MALSRIEPATFRVPPSTGYKYRSEVSNSPGTVDQWEIFRLFQKPVAPSTLYNTE